MDMKLIGSTFLLIFLAELGDKTQLATFSIAAQSGKKWSIFIGASIALVATSLLAALLGGMLGDLIRPEYVRTGAGILFIIFGILIIFGRL